MSRTKTATQRRAPVEGAVLFYTLVPETEEDLYAFARATVERMDRGYTPIPEGWRKGAAAAGWIMVAHWVIPPPRVAGEAL